MADERLLGRPRVRRKLTELARKDVSFDAPDPAQLTPANGWRIDDLCQGLPAEPPGMPVKRGSWEIARRLMRGYEFADPSIVRAFYDPDLPLQGRNMLLKLQALRLLHVYVGVRVGDVYEETREVAGRQALVWGWSYRTLAGHVERGQMDWEVWKWLDSGEVEFRVHAVSRPAHIPNPFVRVGFRLLRRHEREAFLESTKRRMRSFTELALENDHRVEPLREAAARLTARPMRDGDAAHDVLARSMSAQHQTGDARDVM
jgi:uncharacterized protein (UPF0548 family)